MNVKKIIRKLIAPQMFVLVGVAVVAVISVRAAYNDFQTNTDINIRITDLEHTYSLKSSGNIESMKVNSGNIQVTMAASSKLEFTSQDSDTLVVSGQTSSVQSISYGCSGGQSGVQMAFGSSDTTQTLTITPSTTKCTITSSAGGSGGSGGGGGGAAAAAPAAGPAVAPVLPTVGEAPAPVAAPAPTVTPGAPVTAPTIVADAAQLTQSLGITRNQTAEKQFETKVVQDIKEFKVVLPETDRKVLTNFVTYGISEATKKLGSGERRALVRDQLETLGRVSINALEQLTNGQKPTDRNLPKEVAQLKKVLPTFKKLIGRSPDFKNPNEDLAWNTMLYRVRFTRDLSKERVGIGTFKAKFGRLPKSPLDWAVVRAAGYALVK